MELKEYLRIVFRRKWVIVAATVAGLAIALVATLLTTPVYIATATLRVASAPQGSLESISYNTYYADVLRNTYARIVTSAPMRAELEKELGVKSPSVKVTAPPDTELMVITVEDQSPAMAAKAANALADLLIVYVRTTETASGKTGQEILGEQLAQAQTELQQARSQYASLVAATPNESEAIASSSRLVKMREDAYATLLSLYERVRATQSLRGTPLSVIEPASIPQVPSQPRMGMNIALGLLIGLLGGVGLAFVLENLDTTLNTTAQIEQVTQRHVLGKIPPIKQVNKLFLNSHTPGGDAFRHIRTSLLNFVPTDTPQTLLVTSAEAGEGKSTIAVNLAYTLTQSRRRVLLIDCDMRLPTLHKILDLPNESGLSDILNGKKRPEEVQQFSTKIETWVITSGIVPHNPAELLESDEMLEMLRQARQQFDLVILDAPALLAVTDAAVLASKVDAVLLVVDRSRARQNSAKAAGRVLDSSKAKSVGIVVNRAEGESRDGYYSKHQRSN